MPVYVGVETVVRIVESSATVGRVAGAFVNPVSCFLLATEREEFEDRTDTRCSGVYSLHYIISNTRHMIGYVSCFLLCLIAMKRQVMNLARPPRL